jgi:hypothetical protein
MGSPMGGSGGSAGIGGALGGGSTTGSLGSGSCIVDLGVMAGSYTAVLVASKRCSLWFVPHPACLDGLLLRSFAIGAKKNRLRPNGAKILDCGRSLVVDHP